MPEGGHNSGDIWPNEIATKNTTVWPPTGSVLEGKLMGPRLFQGNHWAGDMAVMGDDFFF